MRHSLLSLQHMIEHTPEPIELRKARVTINEARPEDVSAIAEVRKVTWLATYPNEEFGVTEQAILSMVDNPQTLHQLQTEIEKNSDDVHTWVAKDGEQVVGICYALREADKDGQRMENLERLYILPEYQSLEIGKKLLDRCIEWFGPDTKVHLGVATYNKGAIRFYERNGFEIVSEYNMDLPDGTPLPTFDMALKSSGEEKV